MTVTEVTGPPAVPEWDTPDRLRKSLRHAGLESNEMAEYLEVTRQTISNWINGRTRPPATALRLWALRCNVPYEWLRGLVVSANEVHAALFSEPDKPSGLPGNGGGYTDLENNELVRDFRKQLDGLRVDNTQVAP